MPPCHGNNKGLLPLVAINSKGYATGLISKSREYDFSKNRTRTLSATLRLGGQKFMAKASSEITLNPFGIICYTAKADDALHGKHKQNTAVP